MSLLCSIISNDWILCILGCKNIKNTSIVMILINNGISNLKALMYLSLVITEKEINILYDWLLFLENKH